MKIYLSDFCLNTLRDFFTGWDINKKVNNIIKSMKRCFSKWIFVFFILILSAGCSFFSKNRKLVITYTMENVKGFVPSRQTVIWLEKADSTFVKTLFVSDYMAYGGYLVPGICPDWSTKSNWKNISQEEFDAVSGATPQAGKVKLKLELPKEQIPNGDYKLFMEIHLTEKYNVLCSGAINFSNKKATTNLRINYIPAKYPKLKGEFISDIQVTYK